LSNARYVRQMPVGRRDFDGVSKTSQFADTRLQNGLKLLLLLQNDDTDERADADDSDVTLHAASFVAT